METCSALVFPNTPWAARAAIDPRLQSPDNRIEKQSFSGQNLDGKDFRGKVLIGVKLKGTRLRGADFSDAIICDSDLSDADLTGARLDRALIGGSTDLQGANLTDASARDLQIAVAAGQIRVNGADLRGARISCDFVNTGGYCVGHDIAFSSMFGADLRGAAIDHLGSPPGLATARLDGLTTQLIDDSEIDFAQLADGVGDTRRMTFVPNEFYSGHPGEFTGAELRRLPAAPRQTHARSLRPSFDCSRARTAVEKAICADPKLTALDSALDWLWQRVEHTPQQKAEQSRWSRARAICPPPAGDSRGSFVSSADPHGCIGLAYAERIKALAPRASPAALQTGTYTSDEPLKLPRGRYTGLIEKFLVARGIRKDEITVKKAGTRPAEISGSGVWGNGHMCGFEAKEDEVERVGWQFRIADMPTALRDDRYSISVVITPQVIIWVGGPRQFQCGARGGWSDAYFRQPDGLVSKIERPQGSE